MTATERWLAAVHDPNLEGASDEDLDSAAVELGIDFPSDYRAVMREANGGDSEFGESWIVLWKVTELVERNLGYRVRDFVPGFAFFGSNGAGEAYAWDWRIKGKLRYVVIPFIVPEPDAAVHCGNTFEEFLSVLYGGIPFNRKDES